MRLWVPRWLTTNHLATLGEVTEEVWGDGVTTLRSTIGFGPDDEPG